MEQGIVSAISRDEYSHLVGKGIIKCFLEGYEVKNEYNVGKKGGKKGVHFTLKTEFGDIVKFYSVDLDDAKFIENFNAPKGALYIEIDAIQINYTTDLGNLSIEGDSIQQFTINSILDYDK